MKQRVKGKSRHNAVPQAFLYILVECTVSVCTVTIRHFSLLNVTAAGACGYDFPCDGERLVRAYLRRRRGTI